MATHITKACASAFFYLYNIRYIRKYFTGECTEKMTHAFITNRLHYCNSLLYGVPGHQMQKLQRVMNASARLIFCAPKYCHITQLLQQLHWLPIRLGIENLGLQSLPCTLTPYLPRLVATKNFNPQSGRIRRCFRQARATTLATRIIMTLREKKKTGLSRKIWMTTRETISKHARFKMEAMAYGVRTACRWKRPDPELGKRKQPTKKTCMIASSTGKGRSIYLLHSPKHRRCEGL